jgi:hypothetical protein
MAAYTTLLLIVGLAGVTAFLAEEFETVRTLFGLYFLGVLFSAIVANVLVGMLPRK